MCFIRTLDVGLWPETIPVGADVVDLSNCWIVSNILRIPILTSLYAADRIMEDYPGLR